MADSDGTNCSLGNIVGFDSNAFLHVAFIILHPLKLPLACVTPCVVHPGTLRLHPDPQTSSSVTSSFSACPLPQPQSEALEFFCQAPLDKSAQVLCATDLSDGELALWGMSAGTVQSGKLALLMKLHSFLVSSPLSNGRTRCLMIDKFFFDALLGFVGTLGNFHGDGFLVVG